MAADPLVSPDWLGRHLGDVTVVDCRFDLFDPPAARAAYLAGHIEGAAFLDLVEDLSDLSRAPGSGRHPLPSPEALTASARRVGVRPDRPVVAYDDAMTGGAARAWWLLTHYGHDDVRVLDGGLTAWDGPLAAGEEHPEPGTFTAGPGRRALLDPVAIRDGLERGELTLLDARAADRYRGEDATGLDPVAGHIPGARSLPFPEAMRSLPEDVAAGGAIAVYCGSGVTACVTLLALERAGRPDAALYPGSWSEWSRRGLPAATGDTP